MKQFEYIIKDEQGIHARPAGELVKVCKNFTSQIEILAGDKKGDAKKIFAIMGLGVKNGTSVILTAEGADEDEAIEAVKNFMEENL